MILFVDDEKHYVQNILDELDLLDVRYTFCSGVDAAIEVIRTRASEIDAVVCDVMMPSGHAFTAEETEDNLITGLRFLARIRELGYKRLVLLLTNLEPGRAPGVDNASTNYPPCRILRKRELWSFEIAEQIKDDITELIEKED